MTSFDNSPKQLAKDQQVAQREGLPIETHQGDMADLGYQTNTALNLSKGVYRAPFE